MADQMLGPTGSPLAGWGNDDLLLTERARADLQDADPALLAVLDWPQLRTAFRRHDTPSNFSRRAVRRSGLLAMVLLGLGLTSAMAAQKLGTSLSQNVAIAFSVISGVMGLYIVLSGRTRSHWLINRAWTERLRQLYFQVIVNHLPLAARALREATSESLVERGPALRAWDEERSKALSFLEAELRDDEAHMIDRFCADRAEVHTWIKSAWAQPLVLGKVGPEGERLIELLGRQRIGIQLEYVHKKLRAGASSPVSQRNWIAMLSILFSVFAVVFGLIALPVVAVTRSNWLPEIVMLQAACSAVVVFVSALDRGMAVSQDADRYEWYLATLEHLNTKFAYAADANGKLTALRELEETSYKEMRRFFLAHRAGHLFN